MVNRTKDKGTRAETKVVNFLTEAGLRAMRVAQKGNKDQGDVHIIGGHGCVSAVLEVKGGKQTSKYGRKQFEDWVEEARTEAANVGNVRGFLIIAKHGSSTKDYQVWDDEAKRFWFLDQFASYAKGGY